MTDAGSIASTPQFFQSLGLPAALGYATFLAEPVGGLLILAGLKVRWVAAALVPVLLGDGSFALANALRARKLRRMEAYA